MTETAGQALRATREARGLTLQDIARVTHIRPAQLAALEADDYAALPSLTQARGFLRNYAEHLGLDPEVVLSRYDSASRRSVLPALRIPGARASARAAARAAPPLDPARRPPPTRRPADARQPGAPRVRSRGLRIFSADVFVAGTVTLALAALLAWGGSQLAAGAAAPATPTRASLVAIVTPAPAATAAQVAAPEPTAEPEATANTTAYSGVNVTVHAELRSWVSVSVDGLKIYSGLMPPGEAREFVAQNVIEVLTGNGRGTRITYNGSDQGAMGDLGQVVVRLWTLQGMQTPTPTPTQ
jgi:cytoskeleton protein RodZ